MFRWISRRLDNLEPTGHCIGDDAVRVVDDAKIPDGLVWCGGKVFSMCDGDYVAAPVTAVPPEIEAFTGERIPLQPVERVHITTLVDNMLDVFAADVGPAKRHPLGAWPRRAIAGDQRQGVVDELVDGPVGEHGFSALVDVELAGGDWHRLLFDAGISPDGVVSNMGRLGLAPDSIEVVVCSHGHFDHTTGLDGLARALGGQANLPVLDPPGVLVQAAHRATRAGAVRHAGHQPRGAAGCGL